MTDTFVGDYSRDGFTCSSAPVLPPETVEAAVEGMDAVRTGVYDTGTPPPPSPWNPGDDPSVLCKIELANQASRQIQQALLHPALGRFVAEATGAEAVQVWWLQLLVKPPASSSGAATSVGWHQDYMYWQDNWASPEGLLTAWIALSDVTPDAGPMSFVPGSQRWGLTDEGDFFGQDADALKASITIPDGESWTEVVGTLPPGGVSLHHALTFHGSGRNTSGGLRRSLAVHLRTESAVPATKSGLTTHLDDPGLNPVIYGDPRRLP